MSYHICTKYGYLARIDRTADCRAAHFSKSYSDVSNCYDYDELKLAMIIAIKYSIMLEQYDFFIKDSYNVITKIDSKIREVCKQVLTKLNITDDIRMFAFIRYMYRNKHKIDNVYVLVDKKSCDQKFCDFIKYFEISDQSQSSVLHLDAEHTLLITTITNYNLLINYKLLGNYDDIVYLNYDKEWKTFDNNY